MTTAKTVVITGASGGIGLEAASQLAGQGHHVVLVGRNPAKTEAAVARVQEESPGVGVDSFLCDFAEQASVRGLAADLLDGCPRIDVLVNNAGTVHDKRTLTPDGIEATFAVNHLGGFLLTELLRDRLVDGASARVVITSSVAHYRATMNFDDLGFARGGYGTLRAYGRSKLANVLYARLLARQLDGNGVTVNCLHPGAVATDIWSGAPALVRPIFAVAKRLVMVSPTKGGETLTFLATGPEVDGRTGGYYEKNRLKEPAALARDELVAQRLYDESARLVGLPTRDTR